MGDSLLADYALSPAPFRDREAGSEAAVPPREIGNENVQLEQQRKYPFEGVFYPVVPVVEQAGRGRPQMALSLSV